MAEYSKVSGQIEGMWNVAMKEAELAGRKAGEAAATEKVLQAAGAMVREREEGRSDWRDRGLVAELRRRLAAEPGPELLTREQWEERDRYEPGYRGTVGQHRDQTVPAVPVHHLTDAGLQARGNVVGPDERPGYRVGDVAEPLPAATLPEEPPFRPAPDLEEDLDERAI